jgi:hypothetical protein
MLRDWLIPALHPILNVGQPPLKYGFILVSPEPITVAAAVIDYRKRKPRKLGRLSAIA